MSFDFLTYSAGRVGVPLNRQQHMLDIAGRSLPLRIVENGRARRLTLRIDAGGQGVRVTIPPGVAPGEIERFINRHRNWLESRLAALPDHPKVRPGIKIPLRGVPHLIVHQPGRRGIAEIADGADGPTLVVTGQAVHLPRRVADFLKRQARQEIEVLVARHCQAIGSRARQIRLKDTRSRWGSCSTSGNLSFSWRIAMAPGPVINYLVAHEVSHLKEMNHGPQFWRLCRQICPDTDRCRTWLKRNGSALQAIVFA